MNYKRAQEILEIKSNELTDINIIKRKYRMMALIYHPDKNPESDANERFQEIKEAYEFLIEQSKYDKDDDDDKNNIYTGFSYADILMQFLSSISEGGNETKMFYNVMNKISEKCEEKSLELLGLLNKDLFVKIYDILYKYNNIFRISEDFMLKIQKKLEERLKNDECIILNPTLEDLFAKNIYKLVIGEQTFLIPLWQHELVYDMNGSDLYVKCIPILPDGYSIDSENNIILDVHYNIVELLDMDEIKVIICDNRYIIPIEELRILKRQQLLLNNIGIPRIVSGDIYNVNKMADIILDVHLYR